MPIELIIYVKDLNMIEFTRKAPGFQKRFYNANFDSTQESQNFLNKINSEDSQFTPECNDVSLIIKKENNSNQCRNPSNNKKLYYVDSEDDSDHFFPRPNFEEETEDDKKGLIGLYVDSKTKQIILEYRIPLETPDYDNAALNLKHQLELKYHKKIEYTFESDSILSPKENEVHVIYRQIISKQLYNVTIRIINPTAKRISRRFSSDQKLSDVKALLFESVLVYIFITLK